MVNFKDVKKGDYLEMAAYSIDLRQKILSAWQNKEGTQRELAKRFKVSFRSLNANQTILLIPSINRLLSIVTMRVVFPFAS